MLSKNMLVNRNDRSCHFLLTKHLLNRVRILGFILLLVLCTSDKLIAQCDIICFDVTVGLGDDCLDTLSLDLLGTDVSDCDGPFTFELLEADQTPLGTDIIDASMIGMNLAYSVTDSTTGNSCWKFILIEDGGGPSIINCPADDTLGCYTPLSDALQLTEADVTDCSNFMITFSDSLIFNDSCGGPFRSEFLRTYLVVDDFNNVSTCTQSIFYELPTLSDVVFPPNFTSDSSLICSPDLDTSMAVTGFPTIDGMPIVNGTFCNLNLSQSEFVQPTCDGGYKIFRTFTITDWCDLMNSIDSTQIIEVKDTTGPLVIAPDDITIGVSSTVCAGSIILPPATVSDFCSSIINVQMDGPMGTVFQNGGTFNNLPIGDHIFIYTATDDCLNESTDTVLVTVEDNVVPIGQCNSFRFIPLGSNGMTTLSAESFDNGSIDQCGPVWFKVKRMNLPNGYDCFPNTNSNYQFDDEIKFCCEDLANNNIMVILRIYDRDPGPGPVSDDLLNGRFNICMVEVEVQDKLDPTIICPPDLTVSCEFPFDESNLSVFGTVYTDPSLRDSICIDDPGNPFNSGLVCQGLNGLALDNCSVSINSDATVSIDSCGEGTVVRTFTATDGGGRTSICQQTITIVNFTPFTIDDISWPPNYTTDVCGANLDPSNLPAPFDRPILSDDICDLVGATFSDEVFTYNLGSETCFKVLRTWKVVNWCNATVDTLNGATIYPRWEHQQILKVINTVAPIITSSCDSLEVCSDDDACGPGNVSLIASATDDCTDVDDLVWSYAIDQDNNNSFDLFGSTNDASGFYPIGTHRILWTVEDRCGNKTTCEKIFTVLDCKLPSPYCHDGLSISLMPMDDDGDGIFDMGMVTIWASDFDRGSFHVCGNAVTVSFSSDPADSSRTFTCDDVGINTVQIWAIDEFGNADFCSTHIDIQNNNDIQNCSADDPCEIDVDVSSTSVAQGCNPVRAINDASTFSSMNVNRTWTILKDDFITPASIGTDYTGFENGTTPTSNPINIGLIPTGAPGGNDGFNDLDATIDEGTVIVQLESFDDLGCEFTAYQSLINITCSNACDGFGCGQILNPATGDPRILNADNPCWLRFSNINRKTINGERWIYFAIQFGSLDAIPNDAVLTLTQNGVPVYTQSGVSNVTGWHRFTDGLPATAGTMWDLNVTYTSDLCIKNLSQNFTEPTNLIGGTISGRIQNDTEENVEDVQVYLEGATSQPLMTNEEGEFAFPDMPFGGSYSIRPYKNDDHLNGISTYDIVLIQKHLLGVARLNSPEKIIAADINNSRTITALDLVELRRLILGIDTEFDNNNSWRFVDGRYEYLDVNNPFAEVFPESYLIDQFTTDMLNIDFTGIKIGDVNGSIQLSNLNNGNPRSGDFELHLKDQTLAAGETVEIPFNINANTEFNGLQFVLEFDPNQLELEDIIHNNSSDLNFGLQWKNRGILVFSWDDVSSSFKESNLFNLKFNVKTNARLSDILSINDAILQSEIYFEQDLNTDIKNIKLAFDNINEEENVFQLLQNKPNPFSNETVVGFYLPEANAMRFSIYDINGKEIYNVSKEYRSGYNEIVIQNDFTQSTGVY